MGWFNSVLKFQKKFDPLSYNISKAAGLVPGDPQQQAAQSAFAAPRPYTGFGQQQVPMQPQMPARQLVGAPRQPMGQPMPMGQPGAPRPLVGTPRLQQQATVNALRTPTPIV